MKLIITADIHIGIPNKLKDCIWSMNIIKQYAHKNNIENVLVCGDLFHDRVSLDIEMLNEVYDALKEIKQSGQKWMTFPGNHDLYLKNSWTNNSLHPLQDVIQVIEQDSIIKIGKTRYHILPFIHYESEYMEALEKIEKNYKKGDVLLTHIGVNNASLNECFLLKNWSTVSFEKSKFDIVFTGHFHCYQKVGENVWYPGSPIPFRFDEGVVDHGFIIFDDETRQVEFIKIFDICKEFSEYRPPDYLTITDDDVEHFSPMIENSHVRLQLSKEYTTNELNVIRDHLKVDKKAQSVQWLIPKKDIAEASVIQNQLVNLGTDDSTFKSWLEQDKPENLDQELLMKLFTTISVEANEKLVVEDLDDE